MIKNYFPIDRSNSIKKKMLIQPFFVDQKVNDSKKIKGLGDNRSWSSSAVIKAIEKDLKRGINNILLFIVPLQKQKNPEDFSFHYEVIRKIKKYFGKDIVLLIDTCLCSITHDGHCGITHQKSIDLIKTHYSLGLAANTYLSLIHI